MQVEDALAAIERAGRIAREQNQAVLEGHLAGSAVVVGQLASLKTLEVATRGLSFRGADDVAA